MNALTISSLPNELLEAIAAAGQEGRVPDLLPQSSKSEWTLSHVSRRFRTVIVGAPALWTLVEVDLHAQGSVEILKLYLARSQACLISATLEHHAKFHDEEDLDVVEERLTPIFLHMDRIRWLRIVAKEWGGELLFVPFRHRAAVNLQHLEVEYRVYQYNVDPMEMFTGGVPRLTFLKMCGVKLQLPPPQWTASLTRLELRRDRERELGGRTPLIDLVAQCPVLVYLYLDISFTTLERRIHSPSLKILYLKVAGSEDEFDFLGTIDMFDTPSLTEFTIHGVHGDQVFELLNSTSLPCASFPALTSFRFVNPLKCHCEQNIPFPRGTSSPPLRLFPALSSLSLVGVGCFIPDLVKGILVPTSDAWPVLKTVTLCPKVGRTPAPDCVLDAIRSHRFYGLPLPKFRVSSALSSAEDWQAYGVDVEVFDPAEVLEVFRAC